MKAPPVGYAWNDTNQVRITLGTIYQRTDSYDATWKELIIFTPDEAYHCGEYSNLVSDIHHPVCRAQTSISFSHASYGENVIAETNYCIRLKRDWNCTHSALGRKSETRIYVPSIKL